MTPLAGPRPGRRSRESHLYNPRGCVPFLPRENASFIRDQQTRLTFRGSAFPKLRVLDS